MQHSLVAVSILLETTYLFLASASDYRANLLPFLALTLTAALAAFIFARRATVRSALVWGALFRATLLFRRPDLSEDLYRYAWDGRVALAGISPYAHPPDDPALLPLRNADWAASAHRDARSVYPPAAQALFRAAAATGRPRAALKIAFAAADLAIVPLLAGFEGGVFAAGLYAAFPLPVFESAGMGHVDAVGVVLLLAALAALVRRRRLVAGAAYGLSLLTKLFSGFALLPLVRKGRALFAVSAATTAAALWLWSAAAGTSPAAGLSNFATRWSGNSVLYPAVETAVERTGLASRAKAAYARWKSTRPEKPWMERPWPYFYPELFARLILAVILAVGLAAIAIRIGDPLRAAGASLGLFLLVSPVLHPWYLLWVFPFAALFRNAAFLYLSVSAAFGYALLHPVAPFSPPIVLAIEYGPFAALLAFDVVRPSRRRPASA